MEKFANDNIIVSYRGRTPDYEKPVKIYRNLNKKGRCYSILQFGVVVAHTTAICLSGCTFHVNEKTRQRIIKNKKKEFHAYIEGIIVGSLMGTTASRNDLPVIIEYNPYKNKTFVMKVSSTPHPIKGAWAVICNKDGVKAAYTN